MTYPDFRCKVLTFTAAHGIDKVLLVFSCTAAYELLDFLAVIVKSPSAAGIPL
jgi:hypothetical protein